ncbi:MAG: tetratricopeptide repeat protein, partial [Myxococcales bacterium]|nr:tetratricopeptide repeat protein [Myxococcales bacterium]
MRRAWLTALATFAVVGCGATGNRPPDTPNVADLRAGARSSDDPEVVARWALEEALSPGGNQEEALQARRRLDGLARPGQPAGLWAGLARGLLDDAHGDPRSAAAGFVDTLSASSRSADPLAPLAGWLAARRLIALRASVADLFARYRTTFDALLSRPGHVGWRAVAELEEWRATEVYDKSEKTGEAYDADVLARTGCIRGVGLAGPFGHGGALDPLRSYPAELPGPWPAAWPADRMRGTIPKALAVTQTRCIAVAEDQVKQGVFYAQAFFTTTSDRELLVAVQGAVRVWVDDGLVLSRGAEDWGSWQRFGAHVSVRAGRHRILARVLSPGASVRVLNPDGTAAGVEADGDDRRPYAVEPPRILDDPNPIDGIVRAPAASASNDAAAGRGGGPSTVERVLAADAAHAEQMDDVAGALLEPLTTPAAAGPLSLELASAYVADDPALPEDARASRARALRERALTRDPGLWRARLATLLDDAEQRGLAEAIAPLRKLATEVPGEPEVVEQLGRLYGRLGWRGEQAATLADLVARFPDDVSALHAYLEVLEETGPAAEADRIAARIQKLEPDAEVDLERALSRRDYKEAVLELERLRKRRPDRKEIAARIAEILARSGEPKAAAEQLEKALAKQPLDTRARFRLADRAYAGGDGAALRRALAAALAAGAGSDELRAAIDLVEGATNLEIYRQDGRAVIREFEAWERTGKHMDGTAARVLDYAAIWVHDDGSSEMLEHEIQRIQSQEAINSESETEPPAGLVLHLRVIKPD